MELSFDFKGSHEHGTHLCAVLNTGPSHAKQRKMHLGLKSYMFFIITPLIEKLWVEQKCSKFIICYGINLLFLHFCVKSELEEQRGLKVVIVISIEFDLFLLVS